MVSPVTATSDDLDLHPLNRKFIWHERRDPGSVVNREQLEAWNRDGFFVMHGALDQVQIEALVAELDPLEQRTEAFLRARGGQVSISRADELTFTTHAVLRSTVARTFVTSPVLAGLCIDLLGPDCRLYWDQAVYKKPGTPNEFPWHQDNGYNFVLPQDYLTCWIPLTSATVENGCPWVVPGAHRRGTLKHWATPLGYQCLTEPAHALPVEAEPGDIVAFSSLTPHRTGPNHTDRVRKAYIVQYAHDQAEMISPDGKDRMPQQDPQRQFPVVSDGVPAGCPSEPNAVRTPPRF